jgi:thioredoxin-related protein
MSKLSKRIELLANVAIIVVAIALVAVLVQRFFLTKTAPSQEIAVGTKISLPEVEWAKNGKTMLVVLQKGCRFCTESAAFYQRLAQTAAAKNVHLIAVLPNTVDEGREYLNSLSVSIADIRQVSLNSISVRGTPTLILVDDKGAVAETWIGKLPPEKESEVLARL